MKPLLQLLIGITLLGLPVKIQAQAKQKKQETVSTKPTTTVATPSGVKPRADEQVVNQVSGDAGKDNVAIYPFTSAAGFVYDYAEGVGAAIEAGFVRSVRFNVVERNRFGSIGKEERFKEVNTSELVKVAAKFGAKYIITGHVTGAATNEIYSSYDHKFQGYQTTINVSFKIIEVETSLIKVSEAMNIVGQGGSSSLAKGNAYLSIDGITRKIIAANFPQRFKFMSIGTTGLMKKQKVLTSFKFWGGSDNGVKVGDVVEVYYLTYVINPVTNRKIEEKNNIGIATITAVNSGSTATCDVYKPQKYGVQMLDVISKTPELIVIEYTGGSKPRGFFDF